MPLLKLITKIIKNDNFKYGIFLQKLIDQK